MLMLLTIKGKAVKLHGHLTFHSHYMCNRSYKNLVYLANTYKMHSHLSDVQITRFYTLKQSAMC